MGIGPVLASRKALAKAGWSASDLDLIEANEAFAAQACAVNQDMGWDVDKVNVNGGAIAIGHPIGASGARILVSLIHEMKRGNARKGVMLQIFHQVKGGLIFRRNYAASSAKTSNGERLSLANWFLRIICATSMPAIVAEAE